MAFAHSRGPSVYVALSLKPRASASAGALFVLASQSWPRKSQRNEAKIPERAPAHPVALGLLLLGISLGRSAASEAKAEVT